MDQRDPDKIKERIEALEGVLIAHSHIHAIIDTIAAHNDEESGSVLIEKFGFTPFQVEVVKQMRLRRLSSDELEKTQEELAKLKATITE